MAIIIGNNGDNTLDGTSNNDLIIGLKGDDVIDGGAGNDLIFGGKGDDTIDGGDGHDVIFGGKGDDIIDGGDGHDLLIGGKGDDVLTGGEGNDVLIGGRGDDEFVFDLGFGIDIIVDFRAGAGSPDRIRLSDLGVSDFASLLLLATDYGHHTRIEFASGDVLYLKWVSVADLDEDDFIFETSTSDLFTANADVVDFNTIVAGDYIDGTQYDALDGDDIVTLATNAAEAAEAGFVVGTAFNAGAGNDTVIGGTLDDVINGDAGDDVIEGGAGADTLNGGDDDDTIIIADGGDAVDGGAGTDELQVSSNIDAVISLETGQTTIGGVAGTVIGIENVTTSGGNDTIVADSADNTINSGGGNDLVSIASGNNIIDAGTGDDILVARNGAADVTANLTSGAVEISGFGTSTVSNFNSVFTGDGDDDVTGNAAGNRLYVYAGDNTVFGLAGNDDIIVGDGSNMVDGGADTDTLRFSSAISADLEVDLGAGTINVAGGGSGTVVNVENVVTNGGNDTITGDANNNFLDGGDGNDALTGGGGNDIILGGSGSDILDGDIGEDFLDGGAGDDRLILGDFSAGDGIDGGADTDTLIYAAASGANHTIVGTDIDFTVDGTTIAIAGVENFEITGGDLNDTITTHDGDDFIDGTTGLDTIDAGAGDDRVIIDDLDLGDTVDGGADTDTFVHALTNGMDHTMILLSGSIILDSTNYLVSNFENFEITGGDGRDIINEGTGGNSILRGGDGNDNLSGTTGIDQLFGDDGSDVLDLWDADVGDSVDGGAGFDIFLFREVGTSNDNTIVVGAADLTVDGVAIAHTNIERLDIRGGGGNDTITGGAENDQLRGEAGNDIINGGDGGDIVEGGLGVDSLFGDAGNDFLSMNDANLGDSADGGADFDDFVFDDLFGGASTVVSIANGNSSVTVDGESIALSNIERVQIFGRGGNDNITGGDQDDILRGQDGDDTISGGDGADFIDGGLGVDVLSGGVGIDLLVVNDADAGDSADGGAGFDRFRYDDVGGTSEVITVANGNANVTVDGTAISLTSIELVQIFGRGGDDDITGGDQTDEIRGGDGDDTIRGGVGDDVMAGDLGDDTFIFASGDGVDIITDFAAGAGTEDSIDVSALGFDSFNGAGVRLIDFATDNGVNTTIDLDQAPGGDQLRLDGVLVTDLDGSDFIF